MNECTFRDLGLPDAVLDAMEAGGFVTPTPIQAAAIPVLTDGHDLIAKAETGTGKTLAFTGPMLGHIDAERVAVQALVLCPTRELAQQVEEVASKLGKDLGIQTALLVGGLHAGTQILKLREGAQIVVGTPGRVLDLLGDGSLRLGWTGYVVLDEADRMLDMGFIDDVTKILEKTPRERQTMLFSATIPPPLKNLARRFLHDPEIVSTTRGVATIPEIHQRYVHLHAGDKEGFVLDLLDGNPDDTCIIFCNTRRDVIDLDRVLWGMGYSAGSLHGDHEQDQRFRVLEAFKARELTTLVATDVAARGLDIEEVTRVVNYDVPDEIETYVHRIGRTGRAGGRGESITLISRKEEPSWSRIVRETGFPMEEMDDWKPTRPRAAVDRGRDRRHGGGSRRGGAPSARGRGPKGQGKRGGDGKRRSSGRQDGKRGDGPRRDDKRRDSQGRDTQGRGGQGGGSRRSGQGEGSRRGGQQRDEQRRGGQRKRDDGPRRESRRDDEPRREDRPRRDDRRRRDDDRSRPREDRPRRRRRRDSD